LSSQELKNKVLFILHLPPPIHGAAMVGKYINESSKISEAFDVKFINLSTSSSLEEIGKGGPKKLVTFLKLYKELLKTLIRWSPDLCYITPTAKGVGFYKDLVIITLVKTLGKKIIYHFHNKGVSVNQSIRIDNILYKFAFRNTKTILLSKYLYVDIQKYVNQDDVFYCPNGIPYGLPSKIELSKKPGEPFRILFLSNMMKDKGVFVLLEACERLKKDGHNFKCDLVGDWTDICPATFEKEVSGKGLNKEVFAYGKKYGEEKNRFYSSADVFVFPTLNETFGLVILEAMQFSLPVIATEEGGIPDLVVDGETGFLFPKKDALILADKIRTLISNPQLGAKMGAAAKKRFENLFTLERFEKNLVEILNKSIESNGVF
jgi:glycosyltransferase involved in cell wall biosynthesis